MKSGGWQTLKWLVPSWALIAFCFQGVLLGEAFFEGDMVLCFFPLKKFVAESFAQGAFPDWWPYDALGQPLASLPIASLFHPTTLLYLALPLKLAWSLQTLLPLFLAPVGMWLLARSLGLPRPAAALSTTLVAVSFWHVLLASQTQMHLAAAALPWFWREGVRVFRNRRGSVTVLALATANLLVGGDPMLLELAGIGLVVLLFPFSWRRRTAWARLLGAGAVGVLLGAVQWVPMLFAFGESPRAAGLNISTDDLWALRWHHVSAFFWPTQFGSDLLFDSLYVGVGACVLALLGLSRPWRYRWPLFTVFALFVLTAVGRAGGLWHLWSAVLPGWSGYQFPVKALGPAVVPFALLAGSGLLSARRALAWPVIGLGGALTAALGALPAALLFAAGAGAFLFERRLPSKRVAGPLALGLCGLLGADVVLQRGPVVTRPFEVLSTPSSLMEGLGKAGVSLTGGYYEWSYKPPADLEARVPDWRRRENDLMLLVAAPASGALFGLPSSRQYLAGVTRRVFDVSRSSAEQDFAWRLRLSQVYGASARLQLFTQPLPATTVAADAELGAAVVRLPDALPRAYVAFAATAVPDEQQVARLPTLRPGFEVMVAPESLGGLPTAVGRPHQPVAITRDVDTISAEVQLDAPGLFVLNEAWSRGWSAQVDGVDASLLVANHAVIGVPLAAGTHRVALEYRTPGLRVGLALSALGALALVAWWWRGRRAR